MLKCYGETGCNSAKILVVTPLSRNTITQRIEELDNYLFNELKEGYFFYILFDCP